ncbi:MAG: Hsp20/alpha crystallin family protein [Erysipelotrichaceae bacterium]|nr:Hsp20/alpha crystallin family protein [Erysipelotrichaceae bacterium]
MYYLRPKKNNELARNFWNDFFAPVTWNNAYSGMPVDISETDKEYVFDVELPGYKKEDVKITVDDGYLTIEASKNEERENSENKNYITRERYSGKASRSWYVGNIDKELIKASFADGILKVNVPKEQLKPEDTKHYISID